MNTDLKGLCLDLETFPCEVYTWGLGEQHIPLEFLKRDWSVCAWAAHWYGTPADKIIYMDNRGRENLYDDKHLIKELVKLMNEADIIIGQNVKSFDIRKLAARAVFHKLPPFRPVKITDILTEERRVFAFTSHKLAYKTELINDRYKKLKHDKYPGFDLWKACMDDKLDAWKEMETYCKYDVLSTEEHYHKVRGWIRTHALGPNDGIDRCKCGSTNLRKEGYAHTDAGKYQIYYCKACGKWPRSSINLLTKQQKSARLREAQ
jgi:hypothetical protein